MVQSVPRYAQVREQLRRELVDRLEPGERVPGDAEVQRRFSVSRVTARRAIDDLVAEGILERRRGSGTYLREQPIRQDLYHPSGWTAALRGAGSEPVSLSERIDRLAADDQLCGVLQIAAGAEIFRMVRVVGVRGTPISLITNHLPVRFVPDLDRQGLRDGSMIATLRDHGLDPARVDETVEALPADAEQSEALAIPVGAPVLVITGTVSSPQGKPLLWSRIASRGDRHRYTASYQDPDRADSGRLS